MGEKLYKIKKRAFPFCMCVAGYAILRRKTDHNFLYHIFLLLNSGFSSYIKGGGLI